MTLELRCPQCLARLHVPDEATGATAKCPHCSDVFDVDANPYIEASLQPLQAETQRATEQLTAGSADFEDRATPAEAHDTRPPFAQDIDNPYAPPLSQTIDDKGLNAAELQHGSLDANLAFKIGWDAFRDNFGVLVRAHGTVFLIVVGLSVFAEVARRQGMESFAFVIEFPVAFAVQWFFMIGLTRIALKVARGHRQISFDELFSGLENYPAVFFFSLLFSLMVFLGLMMLVVPGIYLACRYWPGTFFIVDRNVGVSEAFRLSGEHTAGNLRQSLLIGFYSSIVAIVGMLMFYVGLIITMPLYYMIMTMGFMMITRQPIKTYARRARS